MSYAKEVEIVLAVRVEAEEELSSVTAETVGEAVLKAFTQFNVSFQTLEPFEVSVRRIHTKSDRPWSNAISYLAKARAAVGLAWDSVRQD